MLFTSIQVSNKLLNNSSNYSYGCQGYGSTPFDQNIPVGGSGATNATLVVPNAYLGAQGTFPLQNLHWQIALLDSTADPSYVELDGTVTYVTTPIPGGIQTTQDIEMSLSLDLQDVPLNVAYTNTDQPPVVALDLTTTIGPQSAGSADQPDDAGKKKMTLNPLKFTQTVTGDAAVATTKA